MKRKARTSSFRTFRKHAHASSSLFVREHEANNTSFAKTHGVRHNNMPPPRADVLPCLILGTLALLTGAASLLHRATARRGASGGGSFASSFGSSSFGTRSRGGGGGGEVHGYYHGKHERRHHGGGGGPRRALLQIARESEQVPFEFLPGTSGPAPNYWMLRDAHREIPATVGAFPCAPLPPSPLPSSCTKKKRKKRHNVRGEQKQPKTQRCLRAEILTIFFGFFS